MRGATFAAVLLTLGVPPAAALADERSWVCEDEMDQDSAELDTRAPNLGVSRIMREYRERWDADYIRKQCEAFADGQPHEIRCLNGRRDWDAIKAMVPDEFFSMSNSELRPHYLELQEADDGNAAALEYCRDVGAIE